MMAIWLVRGGKFAEHEQKFLAESRVYCTWDSLNIDLSPLQSQSELKAQMADIYTDSKPKTLTNWASQIWPFRQEFQIGDWVVMPLKGQGAVQIGEITGSYQFDTVADSPYYHS